MDSIPPTQVVVFKPKSQSLCAIYSYSETDDYIETYIYPNASNAWGKWKCVVLLAPAIDPVCQ